VQQQRNSLLVHSLSVIFFRRSQGQLDLLKYAQTDVYNKVAYIRRLCSIRENEPHNFTDRMMTGQAKWQICSRMAL
jgi:hypothetical protein